MARISFFHGITIAMFWNERDHPIAHFHAAHGGEVAAIGIDGEVLAGSLARPQLRLVLEWTQLHRAELLANWERARNHEPLEQIEPLA